MSKFKHRGYTASVSYSVDDNILVAEVENINSLILTSAENIDDLHREFCAAIDAYISDCKAEGTEPDKPYSGTFNCRVGPDAHRKAACIAGKWGVSLNEVVRIALFQLVDRYDHRNLPTVELKLRSGAVFENKYPFVAEDAGERSQRSVEMSNPYGPN